MEKGMQVKYLIILRHHMRNCRIRPQEIQLHIYIQPRVYSVFHSNNKIFIFYRGETITFRDHNQLIEVRF